MATAEVVVADKLDAVVIASALEVCGIVPSSGASLATRVKLLEKHFAQHEERHGRESLSTCNDCDRNSPPELFPSACPFCGSAEEEPGGEADGANSEPDDADGADVPPPDYAAPELGRAPEPGHGETAAEVGGTKATVEAKVTETTKAHGQTLVKKDRKKGKKDKGGSAAEEPAATGSSCAVVDESGSGNHFGSGTAALAVVPQVHVPEEQIPKDLAPVDRFVAEVRWINKVAAVGGYMLAKKLAEGEISGVWKTRTDAKTGKQAYRNFETFCHIELELSGGYVRRMLKMFNRFTEEQFKSIPSTKLRLLIEADESVQPDVMAAIQEGRSRRDIETNVMGRDIGGGGHREPGKRPDRKRYDPVTKPREKKEAQATGSRITLAILDGKKAKVKFLARPAKKGDPERPAKQVDGAWVSLPLATNDVEILLTLMKTDAGEIVGVVEVRRASATK